MTGLSRQPAARHFRRILALLGVVILVIVGGNNLTFQLVKSPKNIEMAQMIYGWARLYKPMMYDSAKPKTVSFGFSWVRDIFDPAKARQLTGEEFFNFGLSGATSYESFLLLQNALYVHKPDRVLLDMESFYDAPKASRVEHQFDERILYVNRDGSFNGRAKLHRFVKINTSGAALGFNFEFLKTLYKARQGTPLEELLPSYQRRDWGEYASTAEDMKRWMKDGKPQRAHPAKSYKFNDLGASVRLLCDANIDIHIYEAPYICAESSRATRAALALMREMQKTCDAPITYHNFRYPNAVSMEGVFIGPGPATFYRPDGHPRPGLGQMMLTRILSLQDNPNAPPLPRDFGVDLLAMDEKATDDWLEIRQARCDGNWNEDDLSQIEADAARLMPLWNSQF